MATLLGEKYNIVSTDETYDVDKRTKSRVYSVTYYIQGSSSEGPPSILVTTGLPRIGSYLTVNSESDTSARCINRRIAEHDTNTNIWAVECSFDTKVTVSEDSGDQQDPTDLTPEWSWSFETIDKVLEKDPISSKPIINTAGEKLFLVSPIAIPILTIERYETFFDPDVILAYVNHTNSSTFWGAAEGQALMAGIDDNPEDVDGVTYRKVKYVIKFNITEYGWAELVLNQGSKHRVLNPFEDKDAQSDASKQFFAALDRTGSPTTVILDKDGYRLGAGPSSDAVAPDYAPVEEDPTLENGGYLKFDRFPSANFNTLVLGPW